MAQSDRVSPRRAGRDKPHPWTMVGLRAKQRRSVGWHVAAQHGFACAIGGHSHRRLPASPPPNPRILIMPPSPAAIPTDNQNAAPTPPDWPKLPRNPVLKGLNPPL